MECQNTTCYLIFLCHIKDRAQNCALHRQFIAGEPVIQFTAEEMKEIAEHDYLNSDSSRVKEHKSG